MTRTVVSFIQNGYFLLLTFATGLFYFCFYLVALTLGLSLSFTVAGVPLITRILRTTYAFLQFERIQTKIYTDITTELYVKPINTDASIWLQARKELLNRRNWIAIGWLMLKLPVGILSLISAALLYITPLAMIATPLLFPFSNYYFMGVLVDTVIKSILVSASGVVFTMVSYRLTNSLTRMLGGYTRLMIKSVNR
ncbi:MULTISPECIES: sensor domain-containing protein [Paenibacillus]|uniref:Sensor domain-containing protein n=1 Tax=Paenibacillus peoriae TaxID=59893 RepID=A0A7H0YGX3_9BACL|nr:MULTISPECIES: sensor domain-containing protein [Paenibacillus]KOS04569.1 luciferase [Paenibacillus polymyxa]QNR70331.1 sensor domain-containing protein [Paenibacillus peoriae]